MRGVINTNAVVLIIALAVFLLAGAIYYGGIKVQIEQRAMPVPQPSAEVKEVYKVSLWDLLVRVYDKDTNTYVSDANVWLMYEKPKNIYTVPTSGILAAETNVDGRAVFESVDTGKQYFILAAAPGYYNAGLEFNMPEEIPRDMVDAKQPYPVEVYLDKKGTILGVQVPLTYRGSSADIAKFVYNADNDDYETQFSFVASNDGIIKYKKILLELNTDNLGSATIDELTVKVGDEEFTFDNVTGSKTIKFDTEQVIPKGATLTIEMTMTGTGLDAVSGTLFTVTLYDVQEGNWAATVEGPA